MRSKYHFFFAHHALRQVAFEHPALIFGLLASDARTRFFNDLLDVLDQHVETPGPRDFSGEDVRFHGMMIAGRPAAVLEMPPPEQTAEAYFVGVVSDRTMEELQAVPVPDAAPPSLAYYTLEKSSDLDPEQQTVFCAWTADGQHLNYGPGPAPEVDAFKDFLVACVCQLKKE